MSPAREKRLLLAESLELSDGDNLEYAHISRLKRPWRWSILIHGLLIATYTVAVIYWTRVHSCEKTTSLNPIEGLSIKYLASPYADFRTSQFIGDPSPEVDGRWHELLSKINVRVTAKELKASNQTSVELPEGGGYLAWLGVYHELHCIRMLRQWTYREYYHPNITDEGKTQLTGHLDHCLDLLRSATMCHADTTLTTFVWTEQRRPMVNPRLTEHKCVDWDGFMKSVEPRHVELEEVRALVNPELE